LTIFIMLVNHKESKSIDKEVSYW